MSPSDTEDPTLYRTEICWPVEPSNQPERGVVTMHLANVTIDCDDPIAVSAFWAAALDRQVDDGASEFFASIDRTDHSRISMFFIKVPEAKSTKNRVHLDLHAEDREAAVERLLSLGATRLDDHDEWGVQWTTLGDIEGNEFCVATGSPS